MIQIRKRFAQKAKCKRTNETSFFLIPLESYQIEDGFLLISNWKGAKLHLY